MNKKLFVIPTLILAATVASVGFSTTASADSLGVSANVGSAIQAHVGANAQFRGAGEMHGGMQHMPGVFGTVTAISGNTITVQSKAWTKPATSGSAATTTAAVTYTVDATNATVTKSGAASSVSAIAVGDTIMAQGTVSGTSVTATKINDGIMMRGQGQTGQSGHMTIPQGNGQPVIGGKVTAVSGNTVTITNSSNVAYTIDVTNAKITKNGTVTTASTVAVGDNVLAQGTINGTSVTAVSLTDSAATGTAQSKGFFGMIGAFFSKLF